MSQEVQTTNSNSSIASTMLFPSLFVISAAKNLRGRAKASGNKLLEQFKLETDVMKNFSKTQTTDVFTSSVNASKHAEAIVTNSKIINKQKVNLKDIVFNKFSKTKAQESLSLAKQAAEEPLRSAKEATGFIKNGKEITLQEAKAALGSTAKAEAKQATKLLSKETAVGFATNFKTSFMGEIKGGLIFEALFAIPEVISKVIPAFKEKGFKEGLKETGKLIATHVPSALAFSAGGTAGKLIGGAIGSIFGGPLLGGKLGSIIGGMIASNITQKVTDKVFNENDEANTVQMNTQEQIQTAQNNQYTGNRLDINDTGVSSNQIYQSRKTGYKKPQDGVYKTAWVNEANQNGTLLQEGQRRKLID